MDTAEKSIPSGQQGNLNTLFLGLSQLFLCCAELSLPAKGVTIPLAGAEDTLFFSTSAQKLCGRRSGKYPSKHRACYLI